MCLLIWSEILIEIYAQVNDRAIYDLSSDHTNSQDFFLFRWWVILNEIWIDVLICGLKDGAMKNLASENVGMNYEKCQKDFFFCQQQKVILDMISTEILIGVLSFELIDPVMNKLSLVADLEYKKFQYHDFFFWQLAIWNEIWKDFGILIWELEQYLICQIEMMIDSHVCFVLNIRNKVILISIGID